MLIFTKVKGAITIMNNNKGFSLIELLAAIVILSLVTGGLVTGVILSSNQYKESIRQSEASELYNTISSLLTNELRFTNKISYKEGTTNEVEAIKSVSYQIDESNLCKIYVLYESGYDAGDDYGRIALGDNDKKNYLLGNAAYTNDLGAKIHSITYDEISKLFTVDLDIGYKDKSIIRNKFNVRALNTVIVDG